jgi:tRNA-specific 2-thiouridylase
LAFFTIGQRKGLQLTSPTPLYVLEKDISHNTLIVGPHEQSGSKELTAKYVNWIAGASPEAPFSASVKIRYKALDIPCVVNNIDCSSIHVEFENPVRDITPGQAAVLYNGEVCLGGGIISNEIEK